MAPKEAEGLARIRRVTWTPETTSTNDLARGAYLETGRLWHAFIAGTQTRGRGRKGRYWHSPLGDGLYLSLAVPRPGDHLSWLPLASGVAIALAIDGLLGGPFDGRVGSPVSCDQIDRRPLSRIPHAPQTKHADSGQGIVPRCQPLDYGPFARPRVRLKWPNDLFIGGRKLGGILCELFQDGPCEVCVVGIGINVNTPQAEFRPDLQACVTSVAEAAGRHLPRGAVLAAIFRSLTRWFRVLFQGDITSIQQAFSLRDELAGSHVRVDDWMVVDGPQPSHRASARTTRCSSSIYGSAIGLDAKGGLLLAMADGRIVSVHSGTVRRIS